MVNVFTFVLLRNAEMSARFACAPSRHSFIAHLPIANNTCSTVHLYSYSINKYSQLSDKKTIDLYT